MRNKPLRDWLLAVAPALAWLALRRAGNGLPMAARIGLEGAAFAAAAWLLLREDGRSVFRLTGRDALLSIGLGLLLGLGGRLCFGKAEGAEATASAFFLLCVLGPAAEEVLYRGLIYGRLRRRMTGMGAAAVSALFFAAAHGTPVRMAGALAAGLALGLVRLKTGSVTAPLLIHMLLNLTAFL